METLESSRVCRLCGQHSAICLNIFDENESHVKKINSVLPILVHEMDSLPKKICHRCSYKLEEFHKFYTDCLKTDMKLKSQLSWMRKKEVKEDLRVPMVQIENIKMKSEPPDYDVYELDPKAENASYITSMSSMTNSMNTVRNNNIDLHGIDNGNGRLSCGTGFPNCTCCNSSYSKKNSTNETLLVGHLKESPKLNTKKDLQDMDSSSTNKSKLGLRRNHIMKNRRKVSSMLRESNALDIRHILDNTEVRQIRIKTEKPDEVEVRSLRPRKQSLDYNPKTNRSTLIPNPASRARSTHTKKLELAVPNVDPVVNKTIGNRIKLEPQETVPSRTLRPRKSVIDYLALKRKDPSCPSAAIQKRTSNGELSTERLRSSNNSNKGSSSSSGRYSTRSQPSTITVKVKKEIISEDETSEIEQENNRQYNGISKRNSRNSHSLFNSETELIIKREKKESQSNKVKYTSKSSPKETITLPPSQKGAMKQLPEKSQTTKCLRSQDFRLRNGKLKYSEPTHMTLRSLKKRLLRITATKHVLGNNLPAKIREDVSVKKVPTLLKAPDNIKHFCEKCSTSFMNKELYKLHVCYYD